MRFLKKVLQLKGVFLRSVLSVGLVAALAACSGSEKDTYVARDVDVLYSIGYDGLQKRRWKMAAAAFDEVERQHPYSVWARQAQLMGAYALYMDDEYDSAILAAERFLSLHPGNENAAYANYLIAVSYYEQISDVYRDQRVTEQAAQALTEVVRRYPDSEYARDAALKLDLVYDQLAAKDMDVGRFYLKQEQYLAAMGRFQNVIDRYGTTSHVPEALHRMVECYTALGVEREAQKYAAVLGHNHPGSKWYRYSYAMVTGEDPDAPQENRSFFARIFGN
ncbi:outer membrane protein assembly factor BamD [Iodidimonas gelatinilytica]|uniref:Outer membrane protein assembly factor BamD n=2 Tax=Iodidimonas TaxID=2066486 RepID=A0A5A7MUM7_9PROT|nr:MULTISPECIES: outer membrane protein assembly factor BamD [Iodidimonas]GEQ98589.1 outer membrane protein assembly factor BamD [Iodidimonas gelatinilytica]GER01786.1 outer membrane protein assembly factor BamD [Iodidimonas gelatinilytica]GER06810.1 outer membrane protein assembly factor BamD [Kordiimonadales bacterium JCM 17843]GGO09902.1 outer membrane protein assembly factor BamD [Iodidimonas muriae]